MNTMAHGIVRLSPSYATDRMRWLSIGEAEASWWQRKVLDPKMYRGRYTRWLTTPWIWSTIYGLKQEDLLRLNNEDLHAFDPFSKTDDVTLDNPAYGGLVRGKLDWVLLSGLRPRQRHLFNIDYSASDHRGMLLEVDVPVGRGADEHIYRDCFMASPRRFLSVCVPFVVSRLLSYSIVGVAVSGAWAMLKRVIVASQGLPDASWPNGEKSC
jgi:hypothetical protein